MRNRSRIYRATLDTSKIVVLGVKTMIEGLDCPMDNRL